MSIITISAQASLARDYAKHVLFDFDAGVRSGTTSDTMFWTTDVGAAPVVEGPLPEYQMIDDVVLEQVDGWEAARHTIDTGGPDDIVTFTLSASQSNDVTDDDDSGPRLGWDARLWRVYGEIGTWMLTLYPSHEHFYDGARPRITVGSVDAKVGFDGWWFEASADQWVAVGGRLPAEFITFIEGFIAEVEAAENAG